MSPLWLPDNVRREREAQLIPSGDLNLSDGRKLKAHESPKGSRDVSLWVAPDGLIVFAEVKKTANHGPLVHVWLGYKGRRPSWEDVRKVRALFFETRDCFIPFGEDDDKEAMCVHLWTLPPTLSRQR